MVKNKKNNGEFWAKIIKNRELWASFIKNRNLWASFIKKREDGNKKNIKKIRTPPDPPIREGKGGMYRYK